MVMYFIFLGIVFIQWLVLFPGGIVNLEKPVKYSQKKEFIILVCIELIFLAGFRALDVGADLSNYLGSLAYYRNMPSNMILSAELVWPYDYEIGYFLFTKFCAWLSLSETQFLFVVAIIIYVPVCHFILRYSEDPLISFFVYFAFDCFGYSLGVFRQMIALSMVLYSAKYIIERKFIKFIIIVALSMTFHTTAFVMIPLYWLFKIDIKNKQKWIFILEIITFVFARKIVLFMASVFSKYSSVVNSVHDIRGGSYIMLAILNLIFVLGYHLAIQNKNNEYLQLSVKAIVFSIFLQIMGYSLGLFGRIVSYYSVYLLILIPILANRYFVHNKILVRGILLFGLLGIFVVSTYNNENIYPFTFIWSK